MYQRKFAHVFCKSKFDDFSFKHVPRIKNQEANDLAQIASGYKVSKSKLKGLIKVRNELISTLPVPAKLSTSTLVGVDDMDDFSDLKKSIGVFTIDNLPNNDWRKPIVEFLQNPTGSTDRKIKYK